MHASYQVQLYTYMSKLHIQYDYYSFLATSKRTEKKDYSELVPRL